MITSININEENKKRLTEENEALENDLKVVVGYSIVLNELLNKYFTDKRLKEQIKRRVIEIKKRHIIKKYSILSK